MTKDQQQRLEQASDLILEVARELRRAPDLAHGMVRGSLLDMVKRLESYAELEEPEKTSWPHEESN